MFRRFYGNILNSKIVVFQRSADRSDPMPKPNMPWPQAPKHQLSQSGQQPVANVRRPSHAHRWLDQPIGQNAWTKGLAQLLGYEAYLSEIVSSAAERRAPKRGKAWAGVCGKPVSLVFGAMV